MPRAAGPFFSPQTFAFFRELEAHNDRAWFTANKSRYESEVQAPAVAFMTTMADRITTISPALGIDPRPFGGSMTRIYRDTRFSKDKRPYKTAVGIHVAHQKATKERGLPGFFLHLAPGDSFVGSGIWHPMPKDAGRIRSAIVDRSAAWGKAIAGPIELGGESYARVPSGFDGDHRYAEDLRRKDFIGHVPMKDAEVFGPKFADRFLDRCRALAPFNRFLATAVGVDW